MTESAFKNIMEYSSVNSVHLAQHVQMLLEYMTSKDYAKQTLEEASNKIKLCNSKLKKPKTTVVADNNRHAKEVLRSKQELLGFKLPTNTIDMTFQIFSNKTQYFAWAGVSFGEETSIIITQALRKLAATVKPKNLKFWGKILGRESDYYVIQGVYNPLAVDTLPQGAEKIGDGVNTYTFWVTNDRTSVYYLVFGRWEELPIVTPQQIKASKKIKFLMTGRLDRQLHGYPEFPGKERHYLKCQISRITHGCQIAPKGIYKPNDDNPKLIDFEDQVKVPEFAELSSAESWAHQNASILNLGRCTHWVDPSLSEEQKQAAMSELVEKDPQVERLKSITEDKASEKTGTGSENPWIVRTYGDNQVFTKDEASLVYAVVGLSNIHWPGWLTIGYKNGWSSIYIGSGLKSTQEYFVPLENKDLQEEPQEQKELPEPNPQQLPKPPAEDEPKGDQPPPQQ